MTYERQFFTYFENLKRRIDAKPLILGGVSTSGGGIGGPAGGIIGLLPQAKVTYDKLEAATAYTPESGMSLLDNLNHIRYQIATISGGGGGAITVQEDDVEIVIAATIVNFEGAVDVVDEGGGKATVTITASGSGTDENAIHDNVSAEISAISPKTTLVDADIFLLEDSEATWTKKKVAVSDLLATISGSGASNFLDLTDTPSAYTGQSGKATVVNETEDGLEFSTVSGGNGFYYIREDLTPQVPAGGDDYDLLYTPSSGTLIVHQNGLTQQYDNYTILSSGVHTLWSPIAGDELYVEYYYGNPSEGVINPTITVKSGSTTINDVTTLNFEGMKVTDDGGGQVTVSGSISAGGGGAATFLDLTDVPDSYSGQGGKFVTVVTGEDELEFSAAVPADIPAFSGARWYLTSDLNLTTSTGWQAVQGGQESWTKVYDTEDTGTVYYEQYESFKVPEDGYYHWDIQVRFKTELDANRLELGIFRDGNTAMCIVTRRPSATTGDETLIMSFDFYCYTTNYYSVKVLHGDAAYEPVVEAGLENTFVCVRHIQDGSLIGPVSGARVRKEFDVAITTSTATPIEFDEEATFESWDTDDYHESVTNPERLTISSDGYYHVDAHLKWDSWGGGSNRQTYVLLNGTTTIAENYTMAAGTDSSAGYESQVLSFDYYFSTNDYIELVVWHDRGSNLSVVCYDDGETHFSIRKVGT